MKRDYKISVAMATYNGEKFIKEQIDSILCQLESYDELIISDDGSSDRTRDIIKSYKDERIKLVDGPKNGVIKNFENAISWCNGKYIFLSDQDDIWKDNKVKKVLSVFYEKKCQCVVHDCVVFDSDTNDVIYPSFFKYRKSGSGILKNIYKNTYIGCCMAIDRSILSYVLPIPSDIEMHDQWIGILAERCGKSVFINDKLIKYRRHNDNISQMKHYSLIKMLKNRIILIFNYIKK